MTDGEGPAAAPEMGSIELSDVYCNLDGVFLEPDECFRSEGNTIHVVADLSGHTLEGWPATWTSPVRPRGGLPAGTVAVEGLMIVEPEIEQPQYEAAEDEA